MRIDSFHIDFRQEQTKYDSGNISFLDVLMYCWLMRCRRLMILIVITLMITVITNFQEVWNSTPGIFIFIFISPLSKMSQWIR